MWIHSSSHDSRIRYLSNTYLEKDPYLKKEHKSIIPGGAMVTGGVCLELHQSDIPCSKGERLFR
jgi:hypothetical protein